MGVSSERRDFGRLDCGYAECELSALWGGHLSGLYKGRDGAERALNEEGVGDVSILPEKVGPIAIDLLELFSPSPSFHCRWRLTDLVAHWFGRSEWRSKRKRKTDGHLRALCRKLLQHIIRRRAYIEQLRTENKVTTTKFTNFELRDHVSSLYAPKSISNQVKKNIH